MALSSRGKVRTFYDDTADGYSRMMDDEIRLPLYAEVLGGLVDRTSSLEGPIVDTSCGSGHMLAKLANEYTTGRELIGVDLAPKMVAIAKARLGESATIYQGDMADLPAEIAAGTCAAVINFFSLHHIAPDSLAPCFAEWHRVLRAGGQLVIATWEGEGAIDYGEHADIVTQRYQESEIVAAAEAAGFIVDRSSVSAVEGMEMDAVHVAATKRS